MNINDYILKEIKALNMQSTVKKAQTLCKDLPITHIPIVENNKLVGCFRESDIQTIENKNRTLTEYEYLLDHFYATNTDSFLQLLPLFADNDCNIIPVLDKELNYIGYYELADILDVFASSPFLHDNGVTIIIEKNKHDYSASEVTQIVESNKARLLGLYISDETPENIQITIKVSSDDINKIIQTFRRYNYNIITKHEDDFYLEDLKNRSDYLNKYLNM